MLNLAPVIAASDTLPPDFILEADTATHLAGDLLMKTHAIAGAAHRAVPPGPRYLPLIEAVAEEARLLKAICERMAATIHALEARAEAQTRPSPATLAAPTIRWHGCTRVHDGLLGLSFEIAGRVERFRLPVANAMALQGVIGEAIRRHSERSSGMPSSEGSQCEGQSVEPPASSSTATSAET